MKKHYTIIDGYNVIGQSEKLKKIAESSLEEARNELLLTLASFEARVDDEIIIVFDAYGVKDGQKVLYFHGIKVIYSKEKETADDVIERLVYELYEKHMTQIKVVTSDMSEQHTIFGSGALRVPSREFLNDLTYEASLIEKDIEGLSNNQPRTRIDLDEATKAKLERLRRGMHF